MVLKTGNIYRTSAIAASLGIAMSMEISFISQKESGEYSKKTKREADYLIADVKVTNETKINQEPIYKMS